MNFKHVYLYDFRIFRTLNFQQFSKFSLITSGFLLFYATFFSRATITTREHIPSTDATYNNSPTPTPPMSPSNYQQPPTPEHPPPNALQAEKCIHERIRPLSQVCE